MKREIFSPAWWKDRAFSASGREASWLAALFCLVIIFWHQVFGFIQFGGMDGGVLINLAWNQYRGLTPYVDFPCYPPVLFAFPAGWAFEFWGPTWKALTNLVGVYSVLTFGWSFLILWRATTRPWLALLFAATLQVVTFFPFSWWWYNQVTAVMLAIYFASVFLLMLRPEDLWARASFWVAVALTAFAKPNSAGLLLVLSHLLLLSDSRTRLFVLLASSSAALADLLFLLVHHVTPILLLQNYLGLAQRLFSTDSFLYCLALDRNSAVVWIAVFFVVTLGQLLVLARPALQARKLYLQFLGMYLAAGLVCLLGWGTNSDQKLCEQTCFLMLAAVLVSFLHWRQFVWPLSGILVFLNFLALDVGVTRQRVFETGSSYFAEHSNQLRFVTDPPLFQGVLAGPDLREVIAEAEGFFKAKNLGPASGKKIFFGPRIDFMYAAFNLPPTRGLPLWWEKIPSSHRGEQWPSGIRLPYFISQPSRWIPPGEPLDPRVQRFIATKFDYCIFLKGYEGVPDMTFLPADVRGEIYEHYRVEYLGMLTVFTRL